jgi:nanoRNase/pAp phosphatase (c-di-AMP/oligoRNAs hydrolase)
MDITVEVNAIKDLITPLVNEDVVILVSETATRDMMAAALGLSLSLILQNKKVKVAYPKQPTVAWSHLIGINKVIQAISNKNFIITLDYIEGSIEKVSYNIEGNKFNLVIEPKTDATELFNEKNVHYNYGGVNAGVIITIGAGSLESLGKFYVDNKELFNQKPVVVIDHTVGNKQYGKINLVRPASSCSELVTELIKRAQLPINSDIATNLYDGLLAGSRNFSSPVVNADTFESAAFLLKNGGRKPASPFMLRSPEELPRGEFGLGEDLEPQLPPDWLKPKIFRGGGGSSSSQPPGGMV